MTREEFYKLCNFSKDNAEAQGIKVFQSHEIVEAVKIKSVYNNRIKMYTNSFQDFPEDYKLKSIEAFSNAVNNNLEELGLTFQQILDKSKIAKALVEQGYNVSMEIKTIPVYAQHSLLSEPHHWNIYAVFSAEIENDYVDYGPGNKRKIFVYTKDGVLESKLPDYNIKHCDTPLPEGELGASVLRGYTEICTT